MFKVACRFLIAGFFLGAQSGGAPLEIEAPEIGIRVERFAFPPDAGRGRQFDASRVVAVREGGPAYNAGVAPGDVIRAVGARQALDPEAIAQVVSYQYKPGQQLDLHVSYPIPGGWRMRPYVLSMTVRPPGQGRWITQVPRHTETGRGMVAGLLEYRQVSKAKYQETRKQALAAVSRGCPPLEDVQRMAGELAVLAEAAYMGDQGDLYTLRQTRASVCQNAADGGLPEFEKALYAMTDARRLDPCGYNPAADYSQVFNDPAYQTFQSKGYYDSGSRARFQVYLRRSEEAKGKCFLDLIEAQLTGAPWKPRSAGAPLQVTAAPPVAEGPKPVSDSAAKRVAPETEAERNAFNVVRMYATMAGEAASVDAIRQQWQRYLATGDAGTLQQAVKLLREYRQRMESKRNLGPQFVRAWQTANRLAFLENR